MQIYETYYDNDQHTDSNSDCDAWMIREVLKPSTHTLRGGNHTLGRHPDRYDNAPVRTVKDRGVSVRGHNGQPVVLHGDLFEVTLICCQYPDAKQHSEFCCVGVGGVRLANDVDQGMVAEQSANVDLPKQRQVDLLERAGCLDRIHARVVRNPFEVSANLVDLVGGDEWSDGLHSHVVEEFGRWCTGSNFADDVSH